MSDNRDGLTNYETRLMLRTALVVEPGIKEVVIDNLVFAVRDKERDRLKAELRERLEAGEHLEDLLAEEPA